MPALRRSKRLARTAHVTKQSKKSSSSQTTTLDVTSKKRTSPKECKNNIFSTPPKKKSRTTTLQQEVDQNPDLYVFYQNTEIKYQVNPRYMTEVQSDISHSMRAVLIDWLIEVAFEYKLQPETMFLTVNYIDRFLSSVSIHRSKLQLVGVTCMFVAAKYEEIDAPRLDEFVYICDNTYTKEDVICMERTLLTSLEYRLTCPTSQTFLQRLLFHLKLDPTVVQTAHFLNEMFLQSVRYLDFRPSVVAASALFLAIYLHDPQPFPRYLLKLSGYSYEEIAECLLQLYSMYQTSETASLVAVINKYTSLGCNLTPMDVAWPPEQVSP